MGKMHDVIKLWGLCVTIFRLTNHVIYNISHHLLIHE